MATIDELTQMIGQKRQAFGQRIASMPQQEDQYRQQLFGGDQQLNSLYKNEEAKIQELYEHDKRLATYADPNSQTYMADPYAREVARATQHQATVGELSDIQTKKSKRKDVLGDALERAMKMLQYGLEAEKFELDSLENERNFELRRQESGPSSGPGSLMELFNSITGLQQRAKDAAPASRGTAKDRAELDVIRKQNPGKTVRWTKNKDNSYTWTIDKPDQLFLEPQEADAVSDMDGTIRKLVAATGAPNPKMQTEATNLYKLLFPEPTTPSSVDANQGERMELINSVPSASDPQFAGTDPNDLFLQARQQAKYLSDSEIKEILRAKGWAIF